MPTARARPRRHEIDEQAHAHELAPAERVAQGEKGGRRAQPRDDIVGAAEQHPELAHAGLRQHHGGDGGKANGGRRAACLVQAVEEPPQKPIFRGNA